MRRIIPFLFVLLSLLFAIGCKNSERKNTLISGITEKTYNPEQIQIDTVIEESPLNKKPVRIIKDISTNHHKLDTTIGNYHINYKKQRSSDTTDLVGPFDPANYRPIDWGTISSYDTVLYYNAYEFKISITRVNEYNDEKTDTITITRKKLADFLGQDLEKELGHIANTSIYLDKVRQDSVFFSLGFYQVDSDAGYGIGYVWTTKGDSLYIEPEIWEEDEEW